jgi:hypothetical protein
MALGRAMAQKSAPKQKRQLPPKRKEKKRKRKSERMMPSHI